MEPRLLRKIVPAVISVGALGGALYLFGVNLDALASLADMPWVIGAAGIALSGQVLLNGIRWRTVLTMLGNQVPMRRAIAVYAAGVVSNAVFVNAATGIVARSAMHASDAISIRESLIAGIVEKTAVLAVLSVLAVGGALAAALIVWPSGSAYTALCALIVALGASVVIRFVPFETWIPEQAYRVIADRDGIMRVVLATLGGTILAAVAFYVLSLGASLDVNPLHLAIVFPAALLLGNLPISVGGWGIREGAFASALGLFGYLPDTVLAVAIAHALLAHLASGIIYISLYVAARGRS